jgi:transposase
MLDHLDQSMEQLDQALEEAGQNRDDVRLLMTHPGVGRIVALALRLPLVRLIVSPAVNTW